ncbi:MAG: hypothetical protein LBE13_20925 [Bacteroidales bacterium]|nr:hypothetical protein [Bacteroidales bacterium]
MNNCRFSFFVPILACCVGIMFCVVILHSRNQQHILSSANLAPQCAHWAIFRTAQLLGIPTEPNEIQRLLPNQPKSHTLAQIVETLAKS